MSGAELVRAYRAQAKTETAPERRSRLPKTAIAAVAVSVLAFGSIIVRAGDDAGVYEVAKQYNPARSSARLPQIFLPRPKEVVTTSLGYAPSFGGSSALFGQQDNTARKTLSLPRTSDKANKSTRQTRSIRKMLTEDTSINTRTSYCVRTCDGFYFPVGNPDSGDLHAHQASCDRACPGADTDIYVAPAGSAGIADAINRKGARYDTLSTAFNHYTQIDSACTCSVNGSRRNYSVLNDFTLRKGDLIMSSKGLLEFQGAENFPYRPNNFSRAHMKRMSGKERASLSKMEAYSIRGISSDKIPPAVKAQVAREIEAGKRASLPAAQAPVQPQKISNLLIRDPQFVGPLWPQTATP